MQFEIRWGLWLNRQSDIENERILKEYIDGDTIYELVLQDKMISAYVSGCWSEIDKQIMGEMSLE